MLDFWATWCHPCKDDFQQTKELKKKWKKQNLEYVYICTDSKSSQKLWKENIEKFGLEGMNIYIESRLSTDLLIDLKGADSYPSYILIDEDQNVILDPFKKNKSSNIYIPNEKYLRLDSLLNS